MIYAFYADSQATLKAIKLILVEDCLEYILQLGNDNEVILVWLPEHKGRQGKEEAPK